MIVGTVSVYRESMVLLSVHGSQGQTEQIEAIVDTGFNGSLSLPSALIAALGLPYRRSARALLADGSESLFDIYEATVDWDGEPRRVPVDSVEVEPLLGMALLDGSELRLEARAGGGVFITPLTAPPLS